MQYPATEALKLAGTGIGATIASGIKGAWKDSPSNVLMAGSNAAMAASQVAAPLVANMTAPRQSPGAPGRRGDQTNSMAAM
jgi:hypothetical protein